MDKAIYGGIGALLTGAVLFAAGLVGIGGHEKVVEVPTETPPPHILSGYTCPSGWTLDLGYAHDTVNPSCTKGEYRVWKNADNGFSHAAKINKDNVVQGDWIFNEAEVPGWLE